MRALFVLLFCLLVFLPITRIGRSDNGTIPPPSIGRLLIIGDSLTNGLYATAEQNTFASIVSRSTGMALARRAIPTLRDAIPLWANLKTWQPDVVVIELGINDVNGRQWNAQWKQSYQALVEDIQASGASVVVCTTFWVNIQPDSPIYPIHQSLNADVRSVATETGATLADLWAATEGCAECVSTPGTISYFSPHYHGDEMHPSDAGHRLIAETILQAMGRNTFLPFVSSAP